MTPKEVVRVALRQGCTLEDRSKHLMLRCPQGRAIAVVSKGHTGRIKEHLGKQLRSRLKKFGIII